MKNLYTAIIALLCLHTAVAQEEASVEKSLFNIQAGVVGAFISHEARLSDRWALRTEVGLEMWLYETYNWSSMGESDKGVSFVPGISVEPRWYYNLKKRANKGYHTEKQQR